MTHISEISAQFGMQALKMEELPHALFYHFGFGLRFELAYGGEYKNGDHIPSFLQAIDRARAIREAVLPDVHKITVLLSHPGLKRNKTKKRHVKSELCGLGLNDPVIEYVGTVAQEDQFEIADTGGDRYRHWFIFRPSTPADIDRLIWGRIALDLYWLKSRLEAVQVYMLDLERKIILQVYDDRGMDVVATRVQPLRPFYRKFSNWILDYDRERIDKVFTTGQPSRRYNAVDAWRNRQSEPPGLIWY